MDTPKDGSATPNPSQPNKQPSVIYVCGECRYEREFSPKMAIRCGDCGHRILYKKRTNRIVVFDGR